MRDKVINWFRRRGSEGTDEIIWFVVSTMSVVLLFGLFLGFFLGFLYTYVILK